MNTRQQALNLIKQNGGVATREQICQLIEFTKPHVVRKYGTNLCGLLVSKGLMRPVKSSPKRGKKTAFILTPEGREYLKTGPKYGANGSKRQVQKLAPIAQAPEPKQPTPLEGLIRGSIIRDLLLNKFDQLTASERCGLLEIYNVIENKTKTQKQ